MMRARMIFGIILMVLAFIFLFGFIVFPVIPQLADSPVFDRILGAVLCRSDETLVRDQYQQTFGSETNYSMDVHCKDAAGVSFDVSDKWFTVGLFGYLVPFLIGLFLTIFSFNGLQKRKTDSDSGGIAMPNVNARTEKMAELNRMLNELNRQLTDPATLEQTRALQSRARSIGGDADFSSKLKQIQEAHDSGLITDEEYQQLRQNILDEMK